jgi:hypothetical protein
MKPYRCLLAFALIFVPILLHSRQISHKIPAAVEARADSYRTAWKIHHADRDSEVVPIPPTLNSIYPSSTLAGGTAFSLLVDGFNFVNSSVVQWNGIRLQTNYMGPTQLTALVTPNEITSPGTATVTVFNPNLDGGISNPLTFTMTNPVPFILGLTPSLAMAGGPSFTLAVSGSNFIRSSTVQWNGADRPTNFISSNQITAMISTSDFLNAGSAEITVSNPGPGGGTSAASSFTVKDPDNPLPNISSIYPNAATAGGVGFSLTVYGSGFVSSSTVQWNGNSRNTTFLNAAQLVAVIPQNDLASAGTALITVASPAPGGGVSNAQAFIIRSSATPPSATGAATPPLMKAGETVLLVVKVTPGSNPASMGLGVLADATSIGGLAAQRFYDDGTHGDVMPGDNSFSFRATVSASTSAGKKILPVTVTDIQGRNGTTSIPLTVVR